MFANRKKTSPQLLTFSDGGWLRYSKRYAALCISNPENPFKSSIQTFPEYEAITIDHTANTDDRRLICSHTDNQVKIWDFDSQKKKFVPTNTLANSHTSPISTLASISQQEFVSGHNDGTLIFWDKAAHICKPKGIKTSLTKIQFLVFLKKQNLLVASDGEKTLYIYNRTDRTSLLHQIKVKINLNVCSMIVSPNENRIVLVGVNQLLVVNISKLTNIAERIMPFPKIITGKLLACTFRADGYLMTGHDDGSIVTIDPQNFAMVNIQSTRGKHPILALQLLANGNVIYANKFDTFVVANSKEESKYLNQKEKMMSKRIASLFPEFIPREIRNLTLQYATPVPRLEM